MGKGLVEKKKLQRQLLEDEVIADIVNGVAKSDILTKIQTGIYDHANPLGVSVKTSYIVYNHSLERIKIDSEDKLEEKRQVLWSRYENIYRESMESGNLMNARATLDSIAKVFGLASPEETKITLDGAVVRFNFNE